MRQEPRTPGWKEGNPVGLNEWLLRVLTRSGRGGRRLRLNPAEGRPEEGVSKWPVGAVSECREAAAGDGRYQGGGGGFMQCAEEPI